MVAEATARELGRITLDEALALTSGQRRPFWDSYLARYFQMPVIGLADADCPSGASRHAVSTVRSSP
jgi:hypothetical protein